MDLRSSFSWFPLSVILSVVALTPVAAQDDTQPEAASALGAELLDLRVGGLSARTVFSDQRLFRGGLEALGQPCDGERQVIDCLQEFRITSEEVRQRQRELLQQADRGPDAQQEALEQPEPQEDPGIFAGLGGLAIPVIQAYGDLATGSGFPIDRREVLVLGRIMRECLDGDPGYAFDERDGTLSLCVTLYTARPAPLGGETGAAVLGRQITTTTVKVFAGDVQVEEKNLSNPANVFPEAEQQTGIRINAITAAGFRSKLFARGENVQVEAVWVNENFRDFDHPEDFRRVLPGDPIYGSLLVASPDSCIDMMFQPAEPPEELEPGAGAPFYCLGRCEEWPSLINTQ